MTLDTLAAMLLDPFLTTGEVEREHAALYRRPADPAWRVRAIAPAALTRPANRVCPVLPTRTAPRTPGGR